MKDGFLKAAAFSPALRVADCTYNAQQILEQLQAAAQRGVKLAVFPEFCLTGYTCGDLFLQRTLQHALKGESPLAISSEFTNSLHFNISGSIVKEAVVFPAPLQPDIIYKYGTICCF